MAYRRIISPALLRQQSASTSSSIDGGDHVAVDKLSLHVFLAPVLVVLTVLVTSSNNLIDVNIPYKWITFSVTIAATWTLVVLLSLPKTKHKKVDAIALYPLGIQLGKIPRVATVNNCKSSDIAFTPQDFIHRDTIVDCVVTELVYSYKVQSTVTLRTKKQCDIYTQSSLPDSEITAEDDDRTHRFSRSRRERESIDKLIHLFSDVETTYAECLSIRSQINLYLSQYDDSIKISSCKTS